MSNIKNLVDTIKDLQQKKYKNLPEYLVVKIIEIEAEFCENRSEAIKRVEKMVDDYLAIDESRG